MGIGSANERRRCIVTSSVQLYLRTTERQMIGQTTIVTASRPIYRIFNALYISPTTATPCQGQTPLISPAISITYWRFTEGIRENALSPVCVVGLICYSDDQYLISYRGEVIIHHDFVGDAIIHPCQELRANESLKSMSRLVEEKSNPLNSPRPRCMSVKRSLPSIALGLFSPAYISDGCRCPVAPFTNMV